jgi:hypothetical protein
MYRFDLPPDASRFGVSIQLAFSSVDEAQVWYREYLASYIANVDSVLRDITMTAWRDRAADGQSPDVQRQVLYAHEHPLEPLPADSQVLGAMYRTVTPTEGWVHFLWVAFGPEVCFHAMIQTGRVRWRSGVLTWIEAEALIHEDTMRLLIDGASEWTREELRLQAATYWPNASTDFRLSLLRLFRTPAWRVWCGIPISREACRSRPWTRARASRVVRFPT